MTKSPFPKLSALWRGVRIAAAGFGSQALAGLAHIAWADRAAVAAVAIGSAEVAYRTVFPTGTLSGKLATLVAAYRQITSAASEAQAAVKAVEPAPAPAVETAVMAGPAVQAPAPAAASLPEGSPAAGPL